MLKFIDVDIPYNEEEPLHGAFYYIQQQTNQNDIAEKGYVKVSVSSIEKGYNNWVLPIIKKDTTNEFLPTDNVENSWYEVDLLNNYFLLNRYVIRMNKADYFSEWEIKGSLDGVNYFTVDHQTDFKQPSETIHTSNFSISNPKIIRVLRYCPIGKRFGGNNQLIIHRLELFGKFVSSRFLPFNKLTSTCNYFHARCFCYLFCFIV